MVNVLKRVDSINRQREFKWKEHTRETVKGGAGSWAIPWPLETFVEHENIG